LTWGIGPTVILPTASDNRYGSEKYGIGPAGVFVKPQRWGHRGAFVRDTWSIAGNDSRADVHSFLIQPLLRYKLSDGWFLSSTPAITANWNAPSAQRWTIPLGGGIGRKIKTGNHSMGLNLQFYRMIEKPDAAPDWMAQVILSFSIPR